MYRILLSTSFIVLAGLQIAWAQYRVRGEVTDSTGVGEPFATVRIYAAADTARAVQVGVTADDGAFDQPLTKAGDYRIAITSVGKQEIKRDFAVNDKAPVADLGKLIAHVADNVLGEVEVVAQKPLVTAEIDRLSYDMASDEDAKSNTILEMLKKVPLVTVDGQDKIMVNGSSNFKIYKNGRPDNSLSGNPSQVLKSLPANMVEKIEVITEPGAKYDAEGVSGILNIVMKDNSRIDGVMGSVNAQYNTNNSPMGSAYITTSLNDKFTVSANYAFNLIGDNSSGHREQEYTYHDTGNVNRGYQEFDNDGKFHYGSLNMSYEIDTLNLITASAGGYYLNMNPHGWERTQLLAPDGSQIYSLKQIFGDKYQFTYSDINAQVNYQRSTHRKGESITLSYQLASQTNGNDFVSEYVEIKNSPIDYTHYAYCGDQKLMEHTFQLDWTRPFGDKHKLDVGAKYIFRRSHSETTTQYDQREPIPSDFLHRTHVGAVYGEYAFSSGPWMARAGVRYEFSRLLGEYRNDASRPNIEKDLNDVVPTLSVGYRLNGKNSFRLNFATRINRPGMRYLDPATNESPSYVSKGNPNLVSARNNSLRFTYSFIHPKITINTTLNYSFSNDQITSYNYLRDNIRYSTYDNIGKTRRAALNLYAQWMPTKKTNLSVNASANHETYISDNLGIENSRWSFGFYARMSQELMWKLRLSLYGGRDDWGISGLYSYNKPSYFHGLSLARSFLKDDRLTFNLYANNPFSSKYLKVGSRTIHGDYTGYENNHYVNRSFGISVSFRFGTLKTSVKRTRSSIKNDDMVGGGNSSGASTGTGGN